VAPELLRFPAIAEEYAAIGSRYWNINHAKIDKIVRTITSLMNRCHEGKLSAEKSRLIKYLTSHSFYGYVVPSRLSGVTLAIDLPNRLLEIAEGEGLACSDRLAPDDFLPGTVSGYNNPYHYDLRESETRGTKLGHPSEL
jgi:hypothetical protein